MKKFYKLGPGLSQVEHEKSFTSLGQGCHKLSMKKVLQAQVRDVTS